VLLSIVRNAADDIATLLSAEPQSPPVTDKKPSTEDWFDVEDSDAFAGTCEVNLCGECLLVHLLVCLPACLLAGVCMLVCLCIRLFEEIRVCACLVAVMTARQSWRAICIRWCPVFTGAEPHHRR
jgi:hypothetical protein